MPVKLKVEASSSGPAHPLAHLERVVALLVANGNEPLSTPWFVLDRDGWTCLLRHPIDFDLLEATFDLPTSILISREHDSILDTLTWTEIKGGVAP
jgi:hypothetical protein